MEVEWGENCREHHVESFVPVYHATNVPGIKSFLREKFASWTSNDSCGGWGKIWKSFKEIIF